MVDSSYYVIPPQYVAVAPPVSLVYSPFIYQMKTAGTFYYDYDDITNTPTGAKTAGVVPLNY